MVWLLDLLVNGEYKSMNVGVDALVHGFFGKSFQKLAKVGGLLVV